MLSYRCPKCHDINLSEQLEAIECKECYSVFPQKNGIYDFSLGDYEKVNQIVKNNNSIVERYRNFLQWLYLTFGTDENNLRRNILQGVEISTGANVLVIGLGLGHDVAYLTSKVGRHDLKVHCQDLSMEMLVEAKEFFCQEKISIIEMNCSNASNLPYIDDYFDFIFHFGGINYFQNRRLAIDEMNRVARPGAQVLIGDESVAPWLRDTDFGKMMIVNNPLWSAVPPIDEIPKNANDISLRYILENCFYILSWKKDVKFPNVNLDVEHIGPRGGTIRKRYEGGLEGINPVIARNARQIAKDSGLNFVAYLEKAILSEVEDSQRRDKE